MAAYYKTIKGKNYDKKLLDIADKATKGRGDGRISLKDAKVLVNAVKDSASYSSTEKQTMEYIRSHYKFTPDADAWFRTEIRKWAATKKAVTKKPAVRKAAAKPARPARKAVTKKAPEPEYSPPPFPARAPEPSYRSETQKKGKGKKIAVIIILLLLVIGGMVALFLTKCQNMFSRGADTLRPAKPADNQTQSVAEEPIKEKAAAEAPKPDDGRSALKEGEYYDVKSGDTMITISERIFGDYKRWKDIYEANKDILKSPVWIFPGQRLKLPKK